MVLVAHLDGIDINLLFLGLLLGILVVELDSVLVGDFRWVAAVHEARMNALVLEELGGLVRIHLAEDLVAVARVGDDDDVVEVNAADALSADAGLDFDQRPIWVLLILRVTVVWNHDAKATVAEGLDCLTELGVVVAEGGVLHSLVVIVLSLNLLADHLLVLRHFDRGLYAKKCCFLFFNFYRSPRLMCL